MNPHQIIGTITSCIVLNAVGLYFLTLAGLSVLSALLLVYAAAVVFMLLAQRRACQSSDCAVIHRESENRRRGEAPRPTTPVAVRNLRSAVVGEGARPSYLLH